LRDTLIVLKALSDETRLRMLMLAQQEELCVCEFMQILEMGQSRVSRHLNILKDAGLLDSRRQGTWMFYSLAESGNSYHCKRIVGVLRDWTKDNDLVKADLAKVESCLTNRGRDGYCPICDT
jgi:ArsR family transcriptional regulator